jgi:hypothetical protein
VNQLLFVDNSLLMFKANEEAATIIRDTVQQYCDASSQRVNLAKSTIFFGKSCPEHRRNIIKNFFTVPIESLNERYLGLPSDVGSARMVRSNILKIGYGQKFKAGLNVVWHHQGRRY